MIGLVEIQIYRNSEFTVVEMDEEGEIEAQKVEKKKKPLHCSGYNMFFKDLIENKPKTKESFAEIAKDASKQWKHMTPAQKNEYALKAQHHRLHLETKKSDNQLYACSNCGKTALHHKDLIGHEKECGKIFPCEICGLEFRESRNLKTHIKCVHKKIKSFNCLICEQKFAFKKDLARHQVVHNGEKPFVCTTCNRTFSWQSNMRRHKKVTGHS